MLCESWAIIWFSTYYLAVDMCLGYCSMIDFFLSLIQLSKFLTQLQRPGTEFANTSVHSDQYKLSCALRYAVKVADRSKTN